MSSNLPSNSNPLSDFEKTISEKLRKDIGDLLPDEALQGLVNRAVENMFFSEREEKTGGFHSTTIKKPPFFVEEVSKLAEPMIREEVVKFVEENKALIQKQIQEFLTQEKLLVISHGLLLSAMKSELDLELSPIFSRLYNNQ